MILNVSSAHQLAGNLGMGLARRELECLLSVASGMTSKQTARKLGVSPDTVDKRLLAATTKLGVTRRIALVAEAFRLGVIFFVCDKSPRPPRPDQKSTSGVLVA